MPELRAPMPCCKSAFKPIASQQATGGRHAAVFLLFNSVTAFTRNDFIEIQIVDNNRLFRLLRQINSIENTPITP